MKNYSTEKGFVKILVAGFALSFIGMPASAVDLCPTTRIAACQDDAANVCVHVNNAHSMQRKVRQLEMLCRTGGNDSAEECTEAMFFQDALEKISSVARSSYAKFQRCEIENGEAQAQPTPPRAPDTRYPRDKTPGPAEPGQPG